MSRRKLSHRKFNRRRREIQRRQHRMLLKALMTWLIPADELFTKVRFHGNATWNADQLTRQAVLWAWQDTTNVTDAFEMAAENCADLKMESVAQSYTAFINTLTRYRNIFHARLQQQFHKLAQSVAGRFWRDGQWLMMAFDGSRVTAPRTVSNEMELCAKNYGEGNTARYRKKKSKGMRRKKNEKNPPQPQTPQVWITMIWHMRLRLPWTWRLGPSNSSERGHVMEIMDEEEFPENTLFCGDAGFVGYDFWQAIIASDEDFLVRVGGNVSLLSERADVKQLGDGIVLCWPKGKMDSGEEPLRLRLVKVKVGETTMWMLTSVLDETKLPIQMIIKYYKMRWGVEVEFRGLKQTLDKRNLRCRKSKRVYVELDWSILGMALAELVALREQIAQADTTETANNQNYEPNDRSLANTMRALRTSMRNLTKYVDPEDDLLLRLAKALVQKYNNGTDKKARYRPKNPDKKPLGEPKIRKLDPEERKKLRKFNQRIAA